MQVGKNSKKYEEYSARVKKAKLYIGKHLDDIWN